MAFGHRKKLGNDVLSITFRNVRLENVKKNKYLGVILDSDMTWGEHVSKIVGKISPNLPGDRLYKENQTFAFIQNSEEFVFCYDFT